MKTPETDFWAAVIFSVAAITDYFDGYIARSQKLVTIYGKLMDPLADKFLVVSALVMLQWLDRVHPFIVILLISREFAITGLRAIASSEGLIIDASQGGKIKTTTQMLAIPFIIIETSFWGLPISQIGQVLLWVSLMISMGSAFAYMKDFFSGLKKRRRERVDKKAKRGG